MPQVIIDPWTTATQFERLQATPTVSATHNDLASPVSSSINFLTLFQGLQRLAIMEATPITLDQFGRPASFYHDASFLTWFHIVFPTAPAFTGTLLEILQQAEDWKENTWDPAHPGDFIFDWGPPMLTLNYAPYGYSNPELYRVEAGRIQSGGQPPFSRRAPTPDDFPPDLLPPEWTLFQNHLWIPPTGEPFSFQGPGLSYPETFADSYIVPFIPIGPPVVSFVLGVTFDCGATFAANPCPQECPPSVPQPVGQFVAASSLLDTSTKRRMAGGVKHVRPLVIPNATKPRAWRKQAGRSYDVSGGVLSVPLNCGASFTNNLCQTESFK